MIQNLPAYISIVFGLTTVLTLLLFWRAIRNSTLPEAHANANKIGTGLIVWLLVQAFLGLQNVYNTNTLAIPPKLGLFGFLPNLLAILFLFNTAAGKSFIDSLPLKHLTAVNIIRIPVEIVLYWLFLNDAVPELMTFNGRNFDILAGITAPLIIYFGFVKQQLSRPIILIWNIIALVLLANIVVNAVLSAPFPYQQFAFDQPDVAILNFPFNWLPAFVVPVVLFGHLVSIRQLINK